VGEGDISGVRGAREGGVREGSMSGVSDVSGVREGVREGGVSGVRVGCEQSVGEVYICRSAIHHPTHTTLKYTHNFAHLRDQPFTIDHHFLPHSCNHLLPLACVYDRKTEQHNGVKGAIIIIALITTITIIIIIIIIII
jgi:hypothetical protein